MKSRLRFSTRIPHLKLSVDSEVVFGMGLNVFGVGIDQRQRVAMAEVDDDIAADLSDTRSEILGRGDVEAVDTLGYLQDVFAGVKSRMTSLPPPPSKTKISLP